MRQITGLPVFASTEVRVRMSYVQLLVIWAWIHACKEFGLASWTFPLRFQQRNIINNTDFYGQTFSLDYVNNSPSFSEFADKLKSMEKPPYIIFFDSSNLDQLLNHVCNIRNMSGQLDRLVAVAFERSAEKGLNAAHPSIPTVTVDFSAVKSSIPLDVTNRRYIVYQLVLLLRARICQALAARGVDYWAMQQDSIWSENFGGLELEEQYKDANMIFDTVGNEEFARTEKWMHGWICGSTFFVRGNAVTAQFFERVIAGMRSRQSTDSAIMTVLCEARRYKCVKMARSIVSSSDWFEGNRTMTPVVLQVDRARNETKMELFWRSGLVFRNEDGTCDERAVNNIEHSLKNALLEEKKLPKPENNTLIGDLFFAAHRVFSFDPYYTKQFLIVQEHDIDV